MNTTLRSKLWLRKLEQKSSTNGVMNAKLRRKTALQMQSGFLDGFDFDGVCVA